MHYTIYVDLVWLVQCYINSILLIWIKELLKIQSTYKRLFASVLIAGTINTAIILGLIKNEQEKYSFVKVGIFLIVLLCSNYLIFFIAYGKQKKRLYNKMLGLYWCVAIVFAGFLSISPGLEILHCKEKRQSVTGWELVIKGMLFLCILPIVKNIWDKVKWNQSHCYKIEFEHQGKRVRGNGLADTGNCLRMTCNDKPVIVAEYAFVKNLFSLGQQRYLENLMKWNYEKTDEKIKVVYIPYHSIGKENGILLGVYIEQLRINIRNERKEMLNNLVALYEGEISQDGLYQVILHMDCVETKDNMR